MKTFMFAVLTLCAVALTTCAIALTYQTVKGDGLHINNRAPGSIDVTTHEGQPDFG